MKKLDMINLYFKIYFLKRDDDELKEEYINNQLKEIINKLNDENISNKKITRSNLEAVVRSLLDANQLSIFINAIKDLFIKMKENNFCLFVTDENKEQYTKIMNENFYLPYLEQIIPIYAEDKGLSIEETIEYWAKRLNLTDEEKAEVCARFDIYTEKTESLNKKVYAKELTKKEIMANGIIGVTKDGKIYYSDGRIKDKEEDFIRNNQGYLYIYLYRMDENGNKIKISYKRNGKLTYYYAMATFSIARIIWAWYNGSVPEGMIVDHIDNKHNTLYDNRLENLQLLTPEENITKEREASLKELPCDMKKPLSHYKQLLKTAKAEYEKEKKTNRSSTEKAKYLRITIYQLRCKIRYWENNKDKYQYYKALEKATQVSKGIIKKRAQEIKKYKADIKEAREEYKRAPGIESKYT